MLACAITQGEHKVFPWLQTFITRKLRGIQTFFLNITQLKKFFLQHISTLQHVLLLLHGERLIENQFLSTYLQHIFPYCTKSVCFSCLQICNIWNWCWKHLVLNIPPQKEVKGGWYPAIVVARVSDHLSHSTCLEMLQPKTDERVNPSVEVHHLVGKLST